jgi:hypothetical protein
MVYCGYAESPCTGPPNSGDQTPIPVEVDCPLTDVEPLTNDRAADRYSLGVRLLVLVLRTTRRLTFRTSRRISRCSIAPG